MSEVKQSERFLKETMIKNGLELTANQIREYASLVKQEALREAIRQIRDMAAYSDKDNFRGLILANKILKQLMEGNK